MTARRGDIQTDYQFDRDLLLDIILESVKVKHGLEQLKFNQIDINYQNSKGWCLLFEAASQSSNQLLQQVLDSGVTINVRDNKGRNALFWALYAGNSKGASMLIKKGIDYCSNIADGITSLHYTVFKNDFEVFKILSDFMNINITDSAGSTPIMCAAFYNRDEMIEHLIKKGANLKSIDHEGYNLLDYAVSGNSMKSIKALKQLGVLEEVLHKKSKKEG